MGMKKCRTCKREIARGAQHCPHCGKVYWTWPGRILFWGIVAPLLLWFVVYYDFIAPR